jgi:hypothetical protein
MELSMSDLTFGPFDKVTLFGGTLVSLTVNGGWNDQATNLTATIVEDVSQGDDFWFKDENVQNIDGALIGTPAAITVNGFSFAGLILSYQERNAIDGRPAFTVVLGSPSQILAGTQLILGNYVGPVNNSVFNGGTNASGQTFSCSNLLNIYGYLEDGGNNFGNSQINDGGLFWEGTAGIRSAVNTLTNTAQGSYGGYLRYRGHTYRVDVSNLPTAPANYRLGAGVNISLLDLITRICQEGGADYLIQLELGSGTGPHRIWFKVIDRINPPSLDQIAAYVTGKSNVEASSKGQELRPDITQAFLIGGDLNILFPMDNWSTADPAVIPFWGFDINGLPITGRKNDGTFYADDDHSFVLNATSVADITGALGYNIGYPCSILEMRCALIDYDSWATFLFAQRNNVATALDIYGAGVTSEDSSREPALVFDYINDQVEMAQQLSSANIWAGDNQWTTVSQRLYEFVRESANTYYGKKFLVKIPFRVQAKVLPQSTEVLFSDEPMDAGFLPDGSAPLNLNFLGETLFTNDDGRFVPFVRMNLQNTFNGAAGTRTVNVNPSLLESQDIYVQYPFIYLKCDEGEPGPFSANGFIGNGGNNIFFIPNAFGVIVPCMVCSLPQGVVSQAYDALGGVQDLAAILGTDISAAVEFRGTSFPMKIHPPFVYPNGIAIAMRSNQFTYGPWGVFKKDGPIEFERDETLVPWEYGGHDTMNLAAISKMNNVATATQIIERGDITEVGWPSKSIGDQLTEGGPTITSIKLDFSTNGVKAEYSLETFIARFGSFTRDNAERLRRQGKYQQQLRRAVRKLFINGIGRARSLIAASAGFMYGTSYAVRQQTPHASMVGHLIPVSGIYQVDTDGNVSRDRTKSVYMPMVYSATLQESVAACQASRTTNSNVLKTSVMGFEGLFRPVSVVSDVLSYIKPPRRQLTTPITSSGLNPFIQNSDFQWLTYGTDYNRLNPQKGAQNYDPGSVRFLAHRGPMFMTGWGYDLAGNPMPNEMGDDITYIQASGGFADNYGYQSQSWGFGAIDYMYDRIRNCWTMPGVVMCGTLDQTLAPGASGTMTLDGLPNGVAIKFPIVNWYSASISSAKKAMASYYPLTNQWRVSSADCS